MLFNVEHDFGDRIYGYLVPDRFSGIARIRLCSSGRTLLVHELRDRRQALVDSGRHETGQCVFDVDESILPGLAALDDLEIYDDETECLIYRRRLPGMIDKRVVRIETSLLPHWAFDQALRPSFQYFSNGVDRYGNETVLQMLQLLNSDSFFVSARIHFRPFAYLLEQGFSCFTLIQEPRDEFAERLLVLRRARQVGVKLIGARDAQRLAPAIEYAEKLPLDNPKELRWALVEMPPDVAQLMSNPLVRQLTTANLGDMPNAAAVASALDLLSTFSIVGLRDHAEEFALGVEEWLGLEPRRLPVVPRFAAVSPLGAFLRETGAANIILEKDLEIHYYLKNARKTLESAGDAQAS